jgi:hypothetical protein
MPIVELEYEQFVLRLFAGESFIDSKHRARYLLRVALALLEIDRYLTTEDKGWGSKLIRDLIDLLEQRSTVAHLPNQLMNYLAATLDHVMALHNGPVTEQKAWLGQKLDEQTLLVPGMIDEDTMKYYKWLGTLMSGNGEVVEFGSWMGCSTCAFAEGLSMNRAFHGHKVYAFDSFTWEKWMGRWLDGGIRLRHSPAVGESFLALFLDYCSHYLDLIEPVRCYAGLNDGRLLPSLEWVGKPIELLVYDMGPAYDQLTEIWTKFSPFFVPNKTLIVLNEYGKLRSENLWRFCRERSRQLQPVHKPCSSTKGFLFTMAD